MEVEHNLPSIVGFDLQGVVGGVEAFFVYFVDVAEGNGEVEEGLVFVAFHAHVVEPFVSVPGGEYHIAIFCDTHHALYDRQNVNIETLARKLFYL
jgi:hypothetical protein